jgi:hypothetical protein
VRARERRRCLAARRNGEVIATGGRRSGGPDMALEYFAGAGCSTLLSFFTWESENVPEPTRGHPSLI